MATRAAIRPRPLDINKQLSIVKDVSELDSNDAHAQDGGSQPPEVSSAAAAAG